MPHNMNTTDIMMLIGLGSIFLVIVFGGARTYKIVEKLPETPRTDGMGCQQMFNTVIVGALLLVGLYILTSVLH